MTKNKRKITTESISSELTKKLKPSYDENCGSNALILPAKKKVDKSVKNKKPENEPVELLSKKKRKALEKIRQSKEKKSSVSELYAELEKFNKLKPEQAIQSLKETVKSEPKLTRTNLSEKIKQPSKKKLKSWEKLKNKNHIEKEKEVSSPDTSDFSTDEDETDVDDESAPVDTSTVVTEKPSENIIENTEPKKSIDNNSKTEELKDKTEKQEIQNMKPPEYTFILVDRPKEIKNFRLQLPIIEQEAAIMEAINENDVVILSGATGCGKTTQVPQFLYEAGYTKTGLKIGITEPRRVAAMAMSKRVSYELASGSRNLVSYHIRYDKNATCSTQIKFMTDGILLQELKQDVLLSNYSVIIIDEAHERSVYTDLLIGLLSIVVRARRRDYDKSLTEDKSKNKGKKIFPLKLVIMSATIRVTDFSENVKLFPGTKRPPVIDLPARQFPVDIHFNRKTNKKYLEEAFNKVVQIHEKEKEGGILVFVTGQQEVVTLCKWLKRAFPEKSQNKDQKSEKEKKWKKKDDFSKEDKLIKVNLNDFSIIPMDEEAEMNQKNTDLSDSDMQDDEDEFDEDGDNRADVQNIIDGCLYTHINTNNPIYALPLYSLLPVEKQELVFQDPPEGQRLVVVATNVAETSITIPNIKYVVDTGKEKVKKWDPVTGVSRFEIERISQSSANQRAGRAGRVSHGKCFRLYSSAVFEEMKKFSDPEIIQRPIEDVVLMLKNYIHSAIPIHKFCLPTIPSEAAIEKAEKMLVSLGALRRPNLKDKSITEITEFGKCMSEIPLNPRFSRMLLLANQHDLLPYAVLMVSVLSVSNFFTISYDEVAIKDKEENQLATEFRKKYVSKRPDLMLGDISVLLGAMSSLEEVYFKLKDEDAVRKVVETHGVRWQAFLEVRQLRKQLTDILNINIPNLNLNISPRLPRPTDQKFEHLRQLVLSGSVTNVARLAPPNIILEKDKQQRRKERGMYLCCSLQKPVYIHSRSVLHREKYEWVVFQDLYKTYIPGQKEPKPYMRNVTVIQPEWLPIFCTLECRVEGLMLNHFADDISQLPFYDPNHDRVMALAKKIFYGERNFLLPDGIRIPVVMGILENEAALIEKFYKWFAKFFIDGVIFKPMDPWRSKFRPNFKSEWILNPVGSSRLEVKSIVKAISELDNPSRKTINDKWKEDKNFLLAAYLEWIQPDEKEYIIAHWPPIDLK